MLFRSSIEYPKSWHIETDFAESFEEFDEITSADRMEKSISNGTARILVVYMGPSVYYYSSLSVAFEVDMSNRKTWDTYETVNGVDTTIINDIEWAKIEYSAVLDKGKIKGKQLFYSTDYELYSIMVILAEDDYDRYIDEINQIIQTVRITIEDRINTPDVVKTIVGEWDCGEIGYLIISDDGVYHFYQNSSKDPDNVIWGTYEASAGIPTHAAGYIDGINFLATVEGMMMDGDEEKGGWQIQYIFAPSETDENIFNARNMEAGIDFTMIKMK